MHQAGKGTGGRETLETLDNDEVCRERFTKPERNAHKNFDRLAIGSCENRDRLVKPITDFLSRQAPSLDEVPPTPDEEEERWPP